MTEVRDFTLPDLGEGLEEGEIVAWLVEVGDAVELNQELVEVETAKAVVTVPAPFGGSLVERFGSPGESLEVGAILCRIDVGPAGGTPTEDQEVRKGSAWGAEEEPQPLVGYGQRGSGRRRTRPRGGSVAVIERPATSEPARRSSTARALAKPPVRKLAKDLGVDLGQASPGSGADGLVTRGDVRAVASRRAEAPAEQVASGAPHTSADAAPHTTSRSAAGAVPGFRGRVPGEVEPVRGIRKRIIEKMERSRAEIPEASCSRDADLTELLVLAKQLTTQAHEQGSDVKITPFSLVMRATLIGLRRFPTLNARFDREAQEIRLLEPVHLGFAADTDRGLMVPKIADAHMLSTLELALELARLAGRARDGSIAPDELTGGTFTVNNYGAFGNDDGDPILNHPEVGILGVGAIRERPWVVDGTVVPRRVATFRLAFDHRVCDGGEAGRFVTFVAELCEQPGRILLHA